MSRQGRAIFWTWWLWVVVTGEWLWWYVVSGMQAARLDTAVEYNKRMSFG